MRKIVALLMTLPLLALADALPARKVDSAGEPTGYIHATDYNALLDHTSGWTNAAEYTVKCDNSTDDTTNFQAALDAVETAGGGEVLVPAGTCLVSVLNLPVNVSLRGHGVRETRIKMKNGANAVAVIQTKGFASLTGTSSTGGTFRTHISDLTIDGNKANNSSGYGLRLYGKAFRLHRLSIESAKQDGLYTEYGGADDFSTPAGTLEATLHDLSVQQNDGNGITSKGPHDQVVSTVICFNNGAWGWDVQTPMKGSSINVFLNPSGGIWIHGGGTIDWVDVAATTATGWGMLIDTSAGSCTVAGGQWTGGIALEIRLANHTLQGKVANTSGTAVKLNGGSANMTLTMFANSGNWFDVTNQNGGSVVTVQALDANGTLFSGTPQGTWFVSGAKTHVQFATATLNAGGYTPQLPQSNGVMPALDLANVFTAGQTWRRTAPSYSSPITINAALANTHVVTATNGTAFTVGNPTGGQSGERITITIRNASSGALGTVTWDTAYKLSTWTSPANGQSRSIDFVYDGTNWVETSRTAADVPN